MKPGRYYDIDGRKLPSVTTVLKAIEQGDSLRRWRERLGDEEADRIMYERAEVGNLVHYWLSRWSCRKMGRPDPLLEFEPKPTPLTIARILVKQLEVLLTNEGAIPLLSEEVVSNTEMGYAGRIDLFAEAKTIPTLFDLKTSKGVFGLDKWEAQVSAYLHCTVPDMSLVDKWTDAFGRVIRLHEDTGIEIVELDLNRGWSTFRAAFDIFRAQEENR